MLKKFILYASSSNFSRTQKSNKLLNRLLNIKNRITKFILGLVEFLIKLFKIRTIDPVYKLYWTDDASYDWHKNSLIEDGVIHAKNNTIYKKTKEFLKNKENYFFIDVGCGFGDYLNLISNEKSLGLDLSEKVIKEAKSKYPNIEFKQGTLKDNISEINKFVKTDLVLFNYIRVLKHFNNKLILEEFSILKDFNFKEKYLIINDNQTSDNLMTKNIDIFTYYHNFKKIIEDFEFQLIYEHAEITRVGNTVISMIVKIK